MAPNILGNTILVATDAQIEPKSSVIVRSSTTTKHDTLIKNEINNNQKSKNNSSSEYHMQIVWLNVILFCYLHASGLYGLYLMFTKAKLATIVFTFFLMIFCGLGITAGAHRLWSHKAYKAKWPLRLLLMIAQTAAHQDAIYVWSRDHRVHHKFTDTDADPYNAKRGFFFSHIGWLMVKKHPAVIAKGKTIDMSDMEADPIVMFQKKFFIPLMIIFCFLLPTYIPVYFWNESVATAFYVATMFRYCAGLNGTWCVNSVAHIWGMKPYEKTISPCNNFYVAAFGLGEGWHNYHHVFPWDYKTSELGKYSSNWTTGFIDFFAKIGWAYDLKTVSNEMIRKRVLRTGDGSHKYSKEVDLNKNLHKFVEEFQFNKDEEKSIWGWDDKDINLQDKSDAKIYNTEKSST
uniref:CSON002025 protein n=1 Tax=Culicoides sonorensis TaxID=179676 RepID=A0A336MI11_CULSO